MKDFDKGKLCFEDGLKYLNKQDYQSAKLSFLKSLDLVPNRISTIHNLINIFFFLKDKKELDYLIIRYDHLKNENVLKLAKAFLSYLNNEINNSLNFCDQITCSKDDDIYYDLKKLYAKNYLKAGSFKESLKYYRKLLKLFKNDCIIYNEVGAFFQKLGKPHLAKIYYEKSLKLDRNDKALYNLSMSLLKLNDYKKGFDLYEKRFQIQYGFKNLKSKIKIPGNIQELKNKTVCVFDEQGIGDTFQFLRFVKLISTMGCKVILCTRTSLVDFFNLISWNVQVEDKENLYLIEADFFIPIISLAKLFNVNCNSVPVVKFNLKNQNLDKKNFPKNKLNIGFSYQGNPNFDNDNYRSLSPSYLSKYFQDKQIRFYQLSEVNIKKKDYFDILDNDLVRLDNIPFAKLYHYLTELDLIFTVDTSIAHYCGILGIKFYLLLNFNSHWNWFDSTSTSTWYPSATIIKQKKINDWSTVLKEVDFVINSTKSYKNIPNKIIN